MSPENKLIQGGIPLTRVPVASFLQPTKGWSLKRWDEEFKLMKEAGFKIIILQSVVDLIFSAEDAETVKALGEDYTKYKNPVVKTLYPSQISLAILLLSAASSLTHLPK